MEGREKPNLGLFESPIDRLWDSRLQDITSLRSPGEILSRSDGSAKTERKGRGFLSMSKVNGEVYPYS